MATRLCHESRTGDDAINASRWGCREKAVARVRCFREPAGDHRRHGVVHRDSGMGQGTKPDSAAGKCTVAKRTDERTRSGDAGRDRCAQSRESGITQTARSAGHGQRRGGNTPHNAACRVIIDAFLSPTRSGAARRSLCDGVRFITRRFIDLDRRLCRRVGRPWRRKHEGDHKLLVLQRVRFAGFHGHG
jgi:hypothetical protein